MVTSIQYSPDFIAGFTVYRLPPTFTSAYQRLVYYLAFVRSMARGKEVLHTLQHIFAGPAPSNEPRNHHLWRKFCVRQIALKMEHSLQKKSRVHAPISAPQGRLTARRNPERTGRNMKTLTWVLPMALLLASSCTSEQRAGRRDRGKEATQEQKRLYQEQIEAAIRDLNAKIRVLTGQIERKKAEDLPKVRRDEYRAELQRKLEELDQGREIARQKLEKLRNSSTGVWQAAEAEAEEAVRDLESKYNQIASEFK